MSNANVWTRDVCRSFALNDDYVAVAIGWAGGYGGGAQSTTIDQVALDNVSLFVSEFEAAIDVDPDTLNPKSEGKWITVYFDLPDCYDPADVNSDDVWIDKLSFIGGDSTGTLPSDVLPAEKCELQDGGTTLMCKFSRGKLIYKAEGLWAQSDALAIRVVGTLFDSSAVHFTAYDVISYLDDK